MFRQFAAAEPRADNILSKLSEADKKVYKDFLALCLKDNTNLKLKAMQRFLVKRASKTNQKHTFGPITLTKEHKTGYNKVVSNSNSITLKDWEGYALWKSYNRRKPGKASTTCNCADWFSEALYKLTVYKTLTKMDRGLLLGFMKMSFKSVKMRMERYKKAVEIHGGGFNKGNCQEYTPLLTHLSDLGTWLQKKLP